MDQDKMIYFAYRFQAWDPSAPEDGQHVNVAVATGNVDEVLYGSPQTNNTRIEKIQKAVKKDQIIYFRWQRDDIQTINIVWTTDESLTEGQQLTPLLDQIYYSKELSLYQSVIQVEAKSLHEIQLSYTPMSPVYTPAAVVSTIGSYYTVALEEESLVVTYISLTANQIRTSQQKDPFSVPFLGEEHIGDLGTEAPPLIDILVTSIAAAPHLGIYEPGPDGKLLYFVDIDLTEYLSRS